MAGAKVLVSSNTTTDDVCIRFEGTRQHLEEMIHARLSHPASMSPTPTLVPEPYLQVGRKLKLVAKASESLKRLCIYMVYAYISIYTHTR